jgi:hypothetical protein
MTTGTEWGTAERFVSGSALANQCNKVVCRCAVCSAFYRAFVSRQRKKTVTKEEKSQPILDYLESP